MFGLGRSPIEQKLLGLMHGLFNIGGYVSIILAFFVFFTGKSSIQEIIPSRDAQQVAKVVSTAGEGRDTYERIDIGAQSHIPNFGRCDRFYLVRKWSSGATDLLCVQFVGNAPSRGAVVMSVPYIADDYGIIEDSPQIFIQAGFQKGRNERTGEPTETAWVDTLNHSSWSHQRYKIEARWCENDTLSEFTISGFSPGVINAEVTATCYAIETSFGTAKVLGTEQVSEEGIIMQAAGRDTVELEIPVF